MRMPNNAIMQVEVEIPSITLQTTAFKKRIEGISTTILMFEDLDFQQGKGHLH